MNTRDIAEMMIDGILYYHHESEEPGFIPRKERPKVKEYKGEYGEGYTIERQSWPGQKNHITEYYIKKQIR